MQDTDYIRFDCSGESIWIRFEDYPVPIVEERPDHYVINQHTIGNLTNMTETQLKYLSKINLFVPVIFEYLSDPDIKLTLHIIPELVDFMRVIRLFKSNGIIFAYNLIPRPHDNNIIYISGPCISVRNINLKPLTLAIKHLNDEYNRIRDNAFLEYRSQIDNGNPENQIVLNQEDINYLQTVGPFICNNGIIKFGENINRIEARYIGKECNSIILIVPAIYCNIGLELFGDIDIPKIQSLLSDFNTTVKNWEKSRSSHFILEFNANPSKIKPEFIKLFRIKPGRNTIKLHLFFPGLDNRI